MKLEIQARGMKNKMCLNIKPENKAEETIIEFFVGKGGSVTKFDGYGDSFNGLTIVSDKELKS